MNNRLLIACGAMLVIGSSLTGQEVRTAYGFQVLGATLSGGGVRALDESFNSQVIKGKPFSATEERRSVQLLGNGTRIESNQSNRLYRDSEGRTRVEDMNGIVAIWDPVAGFRVELDPKTKVARRGNPALPVLNALSVGVTFNGQVGQLNQPRSNPGEVTETLKPQTINGVAAQGTRVTTTIPRGQIGNDRDIAVITERWVSNDLQMLVKSLNSDPRFGDTTYELTRIVQGPQDGYLFQIPSDYTLAPAGPGRNSRGPDPATPVAPGARGTGARSGGGGGRGGAAPTFDPRQLPPGARPAN
jgi:hypothetical protein